MSKKNQIIQSAIELFATHGYENTSISSICTHAEVSKGAVFHHFSNKDELLRAVFIHMAEVINEVENDIAPQNEGLPALERLVNLLEQIFLTMAMTERHLSYQFEFQLLSQPTTRAILKDLIDDRYQKMLDQFQSILQEIPTANGVVDSHMLIAEIDGIALNYVFYKNDYPIETIKNRFINKYLLLLGFEKRK
ncbi:TetR family transcriptional regulator [Photobacterium aquae]|uniref:TetR family transcriptional regulator n=1 Tax=Photobacterium aquae TaxID=1195763 RepID=A0A0J1GYQ4_9GAMM|nr:TetR/AcrR family transcriptional regulator [Photobacterium aquae]KLV04766.1 TetR family transcriptional regulator [Photobacterium aquae]